MTAVTIAPPVIEEGHAVLHIALGLDWPRAAEREIGLAAIDLDATLERWYDLAGEVTHWEAVWPHLAGEQDPDTAAIEKAADEVQNAAQVLISAIAAHCGDAIANEMTNAAGGRQ